MLTFVQVTIIIVIGLILSFIITTSSQAQVRINIDGGYFDPTPIAVPDFYGKTNAERKIGVKMSKIIITDLESSGLFKTISDIDTDMDIQTLNNINKRPNFNYFKKKILMPSFKHM